MSRRLVLFASIATSLTLATGLLYRFPLVLHLAFFAPKSGLTHFFKMQNADLPFRGLYQWNGFDAALLIPYFAVMIVLAIYGIHRYTMVYLYYKHKKAYNPDPLSHFEELPFVTVQLPIYNEQFVIDRLIEAICSLQYPKDKLEIQLLDDSTDETQQVAAGIVERYAALGNPVV